MTHRTLNWLLACFIAILMSCTYMLDGPSDLDASRDVAADVLDATTQAQAHTFTATTHQGTQP